MRAFTDLPSAGEAIVMSTAREAIFFSAVMRAPSSALTGPASACAGPVPTAPRPAARTTVIAPTPANAAGARGVIDGGRWVSSAHLADLARPPWPRDFRRVSSTRPE